MVEESQVSEDEAEVCIAEWVGNTKGKPMACSFLKLGLGKKEEMQFMFDVLKCDELFDMLLSNNVIRLKGGHVIPTADQLAPKKYCKWHDSFSYTTNECNCFRRQIQSALNDGRLMFGEAHQMKLDVDPFPVDVINFEEKKVLVCTDQANITEGKNMIVCNDLRVGMIKPRNPKVRVWKRNMQRKKHQEWKPTSSFLMEKYVRNRWESVFSRVGGYKRERSPTCDHNVGVRCESHQEQP
jgi:hypothetical protein